MARLGVLWVQVFIALILGVIAGYVIGEPMAQIKWIGDIFIKLIMMIIAPLVFFSIVSGIISLGDPKTLGRMGIKSIIGYISFTVIAICISLVISTIFKPGEGLPTSLLQQSAAGFEPPASDTGVTLERPTISDILMGIVPGNVVQAFADREILQVIFFAVFFGVVVVLLRNQTTMMRQFINESAEIFYKIIGIIIRIAPLAVFALTSWAVGTMGGEVLGALIKLVLVVIGACLLQYGVLLLSLAVIGRVKIMPFVRKALEFQILAFSTSSSSATMPTTMRVCENKLGVSNSTTALVVPLGATVNMNGTAIYIAACTVFAAQFAGISFGLGEYLTIITTIVLIAIGTAAIPSASIIMMPIVFNAVGLPIEVIGVILAVDRFLDMVRTTLNVTGDAVVAVLIDQSEGSLNNAAYNDANSGNLPVIHHPHK